MRKRTRSILEELNSIHRTQNNDALIQSTGNKIIESKAKDEGDANSK